MSINNSSSSDKALILGGGGTVGIGWQVGVLTGLRDAGFDPTPAKTILATSAGSVVGALLAAGQDVTEALTSLRGLARGMGPEALKRGNDRYLDTVHRTGAQSDPSASKLSEVGRAARGADTIDEAEYVGLFSAFKGAAWPDGFHCTAIDAETGDLVVWDSASAVPLQAAIAASCALPMLFPLVSVGGRAYMDGGLTSHLNATALPAADVVIAFSCHAIETPPGGTGRPLTASEINAVAELQVVCQRSRVLAIEPNYGDIGASPTAMMDTETARRAVHVGSEQASRIVEGVRTVWDA